MLGMVIGIAPPASPVIVTALLRRTAPRLELHLFGHAILFPLSCSAPLVGFLAGRLGARIVRVVAIKGIINDLVVLFLGQVGGTTADRAGPDGGKDPCAKHAAANHACARLERERDTSAVGNGRIMRAGGRGRVEVQASHVGQRGWVARSIGK